MKRLISISFGATAAILLLSLTAMAEGDATAGKEVYTKNCLSCHGPEGKGDGPVGKSLPPAMKPADMSTGTFKYASDEAKFKELVTKGGAAVGLNPMMPALGGMSDADITNLYAFVLSLKK